MNPEPLLFLSSLVGGRARPRRPFTDHFSSPVPSWGNVPEADSEAVPMAPLRKLCSCFFDDGPRSKIREGDLANIKRKYLIHPSVGMRSPTEFERTLDSGSGEGAVYEAYLKAGFWGTIPSLIGKVSSFFGFRPSQLSPLTWRALMALQVLGELYEFSIGVHEVVYSYYFAPLVNKDGFYHLRSPLMEFPLCGLKHRRPISICEMSCIKGFQDQGKVCKKRRLGPFVLWFYYLSYLHVVSLTKLYKIEDVICLSDSILAIVFTIQAKPDDGKNPFIIVFGYFTAVVVVLFRYANIPFRHQPQPHPHDDDDGEGRGGTRRTRRRHGDARYYYCVMVT
ncbi:hypothetical protein F2Q69_00042944 [Brassica cretica]|uniref:Uncharacterized protein n=1 Tax=Brassica cretica TaxID=69181 RepID=A0A8S9NJK9_BRACR|nr:hypothetical protein F2Q69_00042944 [Brassica cretica]